MLTSFFSEINSLSLSVSWIVIAVSGYFLMAAVSVFDKYLLHSRISKPAIYAFYVSIFSLFALAFIPFGFTFPGIKLVFIDIVSGFFFIYGMLALYRAVQENEISRVAPLVGTIIPIASATYAFFFLGEKIGAIGGVAIAMLVAGGFLVSFDLPIHNLKLFKGFRYSVISAFCQAISFILLKQVFEETNFVTGFVWNRIGFFLAGMSLLTFSIFRKQIFQSFISGKKSKKETALTSIFFVINKIMAGVGSFLIVFAISKGSVSSVNSVGSAQFAFVLLFAAVLSIKNYYIFQEKLSFSDWMQKIFAVLMIAIGIWMFSLIDGKAFYL